MSFDAAFARTVGIEGGYADLPGDNGGPTNFGVTQAVARKHGYTGDMRDLPLATAKAIYQAEYWDWLRLGNLDVISQAVAEEMFDIAVNCGTGIPVPFLQRALNAFNRQGKDYPDMPVSGTAGPSTIAGLKAFIAKRGALGERVMLAALRAQLGVRYLDIIEARPADESFVFGWFANRVLA